MEGGLGGGGVLGGGKKVCWRCELHVQQAMSGRTLTPYSRRCDEQPVDDSSDSSILHVAFVASSENQKSSSVHGVCGGWAGAGGAMGDGGSGGARGGRSGLGGAAGGGLGRLRNGRAVARVTSGVGGGEDARLSKMPPAAG